MLLRRTGAMNLSSRGAEGRLSAGGMVGDESGRMGDVSWIGSLGSTDSRVAGGIAADISGTPTLGATDSTAGCSGTCLARRVRGRSANGATGAVGEITGSVTGVVEPTAGDAASTADVDGVAAVGRESRA